jgi:hypothetical protein
VVYPTFYNLYMSFLYLEGMASLGITDGITAGTVLGTANAQSADELYSLMLDCGTNGQFSKHLASLEQLFIAKGGLIGTYEPICDRDRLVHFMREMFRFEKLYGSLTDTKTAVYAGVDAVRAEAYCAHGQRICDFFDSIAARAVQYGTLQEAIRDRQPMYTYGQKSATTFPVVHTNNLLQTLCHLCHDGTYNWFYVATYDSGRYIIKIDVAGNVTTVSTDTSAYVAHNLGGGVRSAVNEVGLLATAVCEFGNAAGNRLFVHDAYDPENMSWTPVYIHDYTNIQISALKWQGTRLYVFTGDGVQREWKLDIFDFAIPAIPVHLSHTDTVGLGTGIIRSLEAVGALLFCGRDTPAGWTVIDISDPTAPVYIGADKAMDPWTCLNPYLGFIMSTHNALAKYCRFDLSEYDVANIDMGDVGNPGAVGAFRAFDVYGDVMIANPAGVGFFNVYSLRAGGLDLIQQLAKGAVDSVWSHVCGNFYYAVDGDTLRVFQGTIV